MKETLLLRINYNYANLLFKPNEGKRLGTSVKIIELSKDDQRFSQIPLIDKKVQEKYDQKFFFGWEIKRKYTKNELEEAQLLHMKIKKTFEPAGEECGTLYDETESCEICGVNRKQISPLTLKKSSIPKQDIARTITGELVVTEKFVSIFQKKGLKGALFKPVVFNKAVSNYSQLIASTEIELSEKTISGINPFDLSPSNEGEIYKCPKGHTIGLNLLSEPYIVQSQIINNSDFFASKQKIGVKRGLLRPEPIYICSQTFRRVIVEEKLKGFEFEVARI